METTLDGGVAAAHLEAVITEVMVELSRALAQRESTANTALHLQMRREHQLSMSLLSGSAGDPRSLGWLAHTTARAGCLGLWSADREEGGERQHLLTVAGAYARDGAAAATCPPGSGSRTSPRASCSRTWSGEPATSAWCSP